MSAGDEGGGSRRSSRRVTLKWERQPLALPGEPGRASGDTDSTQLALPPTFDDDVGEGAAPSSGAPPPRAAEDAWERQRPRLTPPPFRPPLPPPAVVLDEDAGGALDLVDRRARRLPTADLPVEMSDRYALGDYTAALRAAELILGRDSSDAVAQAIAAASRKQLEQLYHSRLGVMTQVPRQAVDSSEVRWLGLDPRAGFVLSRVDGQHNLAEILDITGMPSLEVLKTLVELLDVGAIVLTARPG